MKTYRSQLDETEHRASLAKDKVKKQTAVHVSQ